MRTAVNPAAAIRWKYSSFKKTPHSPSWGASRAFPRLTVLAKRWFASKTSDRGLKVTPGVSVGGGKVEVNAGGGLKGVGGTAWVDIGPCERTQLVRKMNKEAKISGFTKDLLEVKESGLTQEPFE